MTAQTLCAQVASRLGETPTLVASRGFQPERRVRKTEGPRLAAVDCPFCGCQILVAPRGDAVEAECRGCDTIFEADVADVYAVSLAKAERPRDRHRIIDLA